MSIQEEYATIQVCSWLLLLSVGNARKLSINIYVDIRKCIYLCKHINVDGCRYTCAFATILSFDEHCSFCGPIASLWYSSRTNIHLHCSTLVITCSQDFGVGNRNGFNHGARAQWFVDCRFACACVYIHEYRNVGFLFQAFAVYLCLTLHQQQGTFYFQIPLTFRPLSATFGISWEDDKNDLYCVAIAMCFITTAHWKKNHHFFWCIPFFLNS